MQAGTVSLSPVRKRRKLNEEKIGSYRENEEVPRCVTVDYDDGCGDGRHVNILDPTRKALFIELGAKLK